MRSQASLAHRTVPALAACALIASALAGGACGSEEAPQQEDGVDGGVADVDAGRAPPPPDAGPTILACQVDGDCTVSADQCLGPTGAPCAGQPDCQCATPCDANAPVTGCDPQEVCQWLPGEPIGGACIPAFDGNPHNAACSAAFDPANNDYLGDNCAVNHFCWGAGPADPNGTCARFCPPGDAVLCAGLGNFVCDTTVSMDGTIGLCLEPAPTFTDVGAPCTADAECQGGLCLPAVSFGVQSCSAPCGGLGACPADSACAAFGPGVGDVCLLACSGPEGTATCTGRNADYACHRFGAGAEEFGRCLPNCTQINNMCFAGGLTCDAATGECR